MGIVRRCGRPPRPALLSQKPTRERAQLRAVRAIAAQAALDDAPEVRIAPRPDSRELDAAATARIVAATAFAVHDRLDRRQPPRIPAAWSEPADATREPDDADAHVVCGCRRHQREIG